MGRGTAIFGGGGVSFFPFEILLPSFHEPDQPRLKYALARRLRRELTPPEARLWARLKGKPDGVHFRKQHPIGPFIVDFFCTAASLVIEVEGQVHNLPDVAIKDEGRTQWLIDQGFEVMRIPASEIMLDPDEVALGILLRAKVKMGR
jgi:very-short-patch-repair endonuclease